MFELLAKPKPSNYPAPFPESYGKVVYKITIGQPRSHQALRNIWFFKCYSRWAMTMALMLDPCAAYAQVETSYIWIS